jgi:hypothetical protein
MFEELKHAVQKMETKVVMEKDVHKLKAIVQLECVGMSAEDLHLLFDLQSRGNLEVAIRSNQLSFLNGNS